MATIQPSRSITPTSELQTQALENKLMNEQKNKSTLELHEELKRSKSHLQREHNILLLSLLIVDWSMLLLGFWLGYFSRFGADLGLFKQIIPDDRFYGMLVLGLLVVFIILFKTFGLYDSRNLFAGTKEYTQVLHAITFGFMSLIMVSFFVESTHILREGWLVVSRGWLIMSWLLVVIFTEIGRFSLRRMVQALRVRGYFSTTVLIVGTNEESQAIAQQLIENRRSGIKIVGFIDDTRKPGTEILPDLFVLGSLNSVEGLISQGGIQEVIIPATTLPRERLLRIFQDLTMYDDVMVRMSSGLYEIITTGVEVQKVGNVPLLSINKVRLTGSDLWLKRALDLGVSLAILPILLMIAIPIAILIKWESAGPILHRRRVIGVGGKEFDAFKFRTMYVDGDQRLSPEEKTELDQHGKLKDDPRITKPGRILRPTSLDELPQLINVMRGQMSLVGPRMITYQEQVKYGKWRTNLITVKPGITGLWQVSGRSDLGYEERVMLDMHYIRNYSIWFDLYLLWRTIPAVLAKRGAY